MGKRTLGYHRHSYERQKPKPWQISCNKMSDRTCEMHDIATPAEISEPRSRVN